MYIYKLVPRPPLLEQDRRPGMYASQRAQRRFIDVVFDVGYGVETTSKTRRVWS